MVKTQVTIEVLNFAYNFGNNLRPMRHGTLDTNIAKNICWFWLQMKWNRLPNSSLFADVKIFQIEKLLREFSALVV